jgi:hypothetical protein
VEIEGGGDELGAGAKFKWRTFGFNLNSEVHEFEPTERLAWLATAPGVRAYHAWLIKPQAVGCRVTTEETQQGALAHIGCLYRGRMKRWHQKWLEGLAIQASQIGVH